MTVGSFEQIAGQWGLFAALFVGLLVYVVRQNEKRESAYQGLLKQVSEQILTTACDSNTILRGVDTEVDKLSDKLHLIGEDVDRIGTSVATIDRGVQDVRKEVNKIVFNLDHNISKEKV